MNESSWERLDSRIVYAGRMTIREYTVRLPAGTTGVLFDITDEQPVPAAA